jgi:hypothetical protein
MTNNVTQDGPMTATLSFSSFQGRDIFGAARGPTYDIGAFQFGATPSLLSILLSNSSFAAGSPTGTTIGNISVTQSIGAFSGTLELTGADASSFQITGTTLETLGTPCPLFGPCAFTRLNIQATSTAGATNSPLTLPFNITGTAVVQPTSFYGDPVLHGRPH